MSVLRRKSELLTGTLPYPPYPLSCPFVRCIDLTSTGTLPSPPYPLSCPLLGV